MEPALSSDSSPFKLDEARQALASGTGKGIRIAVIDSGIEIDHPDLAGISLLHDLHVIDAGVQIEVKPGDGSDIYGHGTAVAGVIRRLAPDAEIGSIRVLGENLGSRTVIIREGVRQAIDQGYHILNCSFGCGLSEHIFQYKEWIDEAYLKGIHIVAACNNYDFTTPEWPGYFPSVVTVNMARSEDDHSFFYKPGHLVEFAARRCRCHAPVESPFHQGSHRKQLCGAHYEQLAGAADFRDAGPPSAGSEIHSAPPGHAMAG